MSDTPKPHDAKELRTHLENTSAQSLIENGKEWEGHRQAVGFPEPKPAAPDLPPAPVAPQIPEPPHEDDPRYTVELSTLDKLLSSRRIKKQQAALKRFEKDRKAWNEDRLNALGIYELRKKEHDRQVEAARQAHAEAVESWRRAFTDFLKDKAA